MNAKAATAQSSVRRAARVEDEPRYVVGVDAHSKVLAISVWDWTDRLNPSPCQDFKSVNLEAMARTCRRHVDPDSTTIIEASTNSAAIKRELNELGFRAGIVRSDTIAGRESKRKVCDIQDARNLAREYIKGDVEEFVWTPGSKFGAYGEIAHAYRDACNDLRRIGNRIWNICSQNRLALPPRASAAKVAHVRAAIKATGSDGFAGRRPTMLIGDYENPMKRREELDRMMSEIVIGDESTVRLLQLPGINYKASFVSRAAIEDPRRFDPAAKLAACGGPSPSVNTSGDGELKAEKRGGTGKPLDHEGRRDLKFFYAEAGLTVMTSCAKTSLGRWGWRKFNGGKPKMKVTCAIGHRLLTCAWHVMRGDPTPNRDSELMFMRTLVRLCRVAGEKRLMGVGYASRKDFYKEMVNRIYGHLPKADARSGGENAAEVPKK